MNLKEWRESKGLTQEQAAKLVKAAQPHWSRWELGVAQPSIRYAQRIVEATDGEVALEDLVKKSTGV